MAKKTKTSLPLSNPMWERFCRCYTSNRFLFGNATQSYAHANNKDLDKLSNNDQVYEDVDIGGGIKVKKKVKESTFDLAANACAVEGRKLLRKPQIDARVKQLLQELFNEDSADAELSWILMQREDLGPKIQAIKEFNTLKGRTKTKVELTGADGERLFVPTGEEAQRVNSALDSLLGK